MEDDHHFGVRPLLEIKVAPVPDGHLPAAVLPGRDLPLEGSVVQGVVLGVHGQVVGLRVLRHALGEGPGDQDTVVLEAEVPVERPGVVLLDDEYWTRVAAACAGSGSPMGSGVFWASRFERYSARVASLFFLGTAGAARGHGAICTQRFEIVPRRGGTARWRSPREGSRSAKRSPCFSTRASTSEVVNSNVEGSPDFTQFRTSSHVTGVDTVGRGRARTE